MSNIADNVAATMTKVDELKTAVAALEHPTVDLSPVTAAMEALKMTLDEVNAKLTPTT